MKKIHLHTAATDNLGRFHDSGTSMTVSDRHQDGHIDEARARALVASHGAIVEREAPAPKKASAVRKSTPAKAPGKAPAASAQSSSPVAPATDAEQA